MVAVLLVAALVNQHLLLMKPLFVVLLVQAVVEIKENQNHLNALIVQKLLLIILIWVNICEFIWVFELLVHANFVERRLFFKFLLLKKFFSLSLHNFLIYNNIYVHILVKNLINVNMLIVRRRFLKFVWLFLLVNNVCLVV